MRLDLEEVSAQLAFVRVEHALLRTLPDDPSTAPRRERLQRLSARLLTGFVARSPFRQLPTTAKGHPLNLASYVHDLVCWYVAHHGYGAPVGFIDAGHRKFHAEAAALPESTRDDAWALAMSAVSRTPSGITPGGVHYWPIALPETLSVEAQQWAEDVVRSRRVRHDY